MDTAKDLSLETLYREHRQRLYTVAFAILHQAEEAEDTVHDTFVRLAENRHRLHIRSEAEAKALLTAIARNAAIDRRRRQDHQPGVLPEQLPDRADTPVDSAEADDLLTAVKGLPPLYRDTLLLTAVQGYTPQETAALLGITELAVRQRLSRARKQLAQTLSERGTFV